MRWAGAERLAVKHSEAILKRWWNFEKDIYEILPGDIDPHYVLRAEREAEKVVHDGCQCCQVVEKRFTPADITRLRGELGPTLGVNELMRLESLFDSVLLDLIEANDIDSEALFNRMFKGAFNEGYNEAYRQGQRAVRRESAKVRERFERFTPEVLSVSNASAGVQGLLADNLSMLTSKLSIEFRGEALSTLVEGIANEIPWTQIARNVHKKVGLRGAGWHWVRIVRTEMARTFDLASRERYAGMGAEYVRFSTVVDPCPICQAVDDINGGFRRLENAELVPLHPHCRCRWTPRFSIPEGRETLA